MVRRSNHSKLMLLTGLQYSVPEIFGVQRGIIQIDLITFLTRETGLRNNHIVTCHLPRQQTIGRQLRDRITEQVGHEINGFWSLNLYRRNVNFLDVDIEAVADVNPLEPEFKVRV